MNWFKKRIERFKKKSPLQKALDLLFLAFIVLLLIPDSRIIFQRILLETGVFNGKVSVKRSTALTDETLSSLIYTDIDGNPQSLIDLKGKVVFINYWATWCPPCKAELPSLAKLYDQFKDNPEMVFLFLNYEKEEKVRKFEADEELPFKSVFIRSNPAEILKADGLPTSILIDKQGRIVIKHVGMAKWNASNFVLQIESLIKE